MTVTHIVKRNGETFRDFYGRRGDGVCTSTSRPVISVLRQFDGEGATSEHGGVPHMRLDDEISVATTNNLTQAGSEGMAHTDEDDGGKENTTWVSTASGVYDNACLSKGIVVRLGRLELPRPKALEPKSSASANSATGASGGNHTVACGFVKVPARAQLTPTTETVRTCNHATPTTSQARYADT